jgi:uncharacterized alkaline shock family protein YloU
MTSNDSPDAGVAAGRTTIVDGVVATVAAIAVCETDGIYAVGGSASRASGSVRDRASKSPAPGRGIRVEVGETQAAVALEVVVESGEPIADAAKETRSRVTDAVETMTGLEVVELNLKGARCPSARDRRQRRPRQRQPE